MKKILFLLIACFSFLLFPGKSFADQNFSNFIDITYSVSDNGMTHAVFNGTLQNTSDKYYASSYTIQVGFDTLQNVLASDNDGPIKPQVKAIEGGQSITLPLNTKAVGVNSQVNFALTFDTPNIANHVGSVWEVNIPGVANQADFEKFTVHLRVPRSFGEPAYIKPLQAGNSLDFDKSTLGSSGISLAFGNLQVYNFILNYHLQNNNLFPINTEIALPPTTNYQDVLISDISPRPTNVTMDTDGNWLAAYTLLPSQKMEVTTKGTAYISLTPRREPLTTEQRKLYLAEQPYWQVKDASIQKIAQDLKTPEAIFEYVVGHLHYDFSRIAGQQERLGAVAVLQNPSSAVCLEFTDLFISLARAAGIPAREIDGYAYTENKQQRPLSLVKDILHAWPEYYDDSQKTWIMVDPTWANTTKGTDYFNVLDFDHFAFAIKGVKSTYPVSAGGYKLAGDENTKDVFVSFGQPNDLPSPRVSLNLDISPTYFAGIPISGELVIKNVDSTLVPHEEVGVLTSMLLPHSQKLESMPIPPFGFVGLPIQFRPKSFLTNEKETITIQVAGNTITKTISVYPFFFKKEFLEGVTIAILGFIIFIITSKARGIFAAKQ